MSLLYSNLYIATRKDGYLKKSINILDQSIKLLSDGKGGLTLANGVAGVGWLIKYLIRKEILSQADAETLIDFNEALAESLKVDSLKENKYYDLLFGLIGKGIYFLEDCKAEQSEPLEMIFLRLKDLAIETEYGKLWYAVLGKEQRNEKEDYFDYGLAHGLPSIIIFLSKLSNKGLYKEECKHLIQSIVTYLQKQRITNSITEFPSLSKYS